MYSTRFFPIINIIINFSISNIRLLQDIKYGFMCYTVNPCCYLFYVCILIPYSEFTHLPPSSLVTRSLFSMAVSLFLFLKEADLHYFLDSTYEWYHIIFIFLWLASLSIIISRSIHVAANGNISLYFYSSIIFYCTYIPHLYLFICWWTLRLLLCLGYYKQFCYEQWGACIFLN